MLTLEHVRKDALIEGLDPRGPVTVRFTEQVGPDALNVNYRLPSGETAERMLIRADEAALSLATAGRPWAFDATGDDFKLALEAWRINLAHLFDPMMAVHTSNVEPLPHQITAVYESMLPKQPLRFVLADDPGAGKTIMAGLLVRELLLRADARRVLIVAPGSLVEQWQDEMREKFGLAFDIFGRDLVEASRSGNPFDERDLIVARVDQLARNDDLLDKLAISQWDLVIADEAHKLSANYFGNKVNKTRRFELGELLGRIGRHLLLMTATPHNGKEEDFQLWMSLLDGDRFYGKARDGVHTADVNDLMRRMTKEEMLRFDGTRLFPPRFAYTANYELSDAEVALYEAVTDYVRSEMNRADRLQSDKRRGNVGFALTSLQRRLASSPAAICRSLERRHAKLLRRFEEEKLGQRAPLADEWESRLDAPDDPDDLTAEEAETLEDTFIDRATAAQTLAELQAEIVVLDHLVQQARRLRNSGTDRKWDELRSLLQNTPEMHDGNDLAGQQRKLIVFTEHRDTLDYLTERIGTLIGNTEAVVTIHGGSRREDRRATQERFRNDPVVRVLVATDAAGEGVNLQTANLMVNYDLPWNPNRIEQRFGRIHRIGQTEICHLWNLVAMQTREGAVFHRLFEKLEVERAALGGRVFDILGEVFDNESLRDLLIRAIRHGEDPVERARLLQKVDGALDTAHLQRILQRHALCEEVMDPQRLFAVKEELERAEARKLQPFFVRAFFQQAFVSLGGELRGREKGRFEITNVPALIRERDRQLAGRDRRYADPVVRRYERVTFEREHRRVPDKPSAAEAALLHPAHPLMQAVTDIVLEQHRNKLRQGAVLVDPADLGLAPRLLLALEHTMHEGARADGVSAGSAGAPARIASRRMQFVTLDARGLVQSAGWAPHLDLQAIEPEQAGLIGDLLTAPWITQGLEARALQYASGAMVAEHVGEVQARRSETVDRTLRAVHERLVREINHWSDRQIKLSDDLAAGKDVRLPLDNVKRTIDDLTARLRTRQQELEAMRHLVPVPPVVVAAALVVPQGLLLQRQGLPGWHADPAARSIVEQRAMRAVIAAEQAAGRTVQDVSHLKCGWDITSLPAAGSSSSAVRHIEVKGRAKAAQTVTVTRNEVMYGLNQADKFVLAIVLVEGDAIDGPHYLRQPFTTEPDWAVTSVNLDLADLLGRAVSPERFDAAQ